MAEEFLLKISNLSKSFSGVKVLDNVHLNVRAGTVHALMGENGAGKSTLMKCLFGIYKQDEGEFFLDGKSFNFTDPKHALEDGVSMVHQELNQVLQRTVLDNIWLGRYPKKGLFVDEKKMLKDTIELFNKINVDLDPTKKLSTLSVSQRQMVEIAKAISYNAKVIVLDEPTSSLTENEVNKLFEIMRTLRDQGISTIYISHKMEEIFEISDEVTILRDGKYIGTKFTKDLTMDSIINMMVGRNLENRFPPKNNKIGKVVLEVKNLTTLYPPKVNDVSLTLKKGEILGISGLVGSRRTELVEAIFGARTRETGELFLNGKQIKNSNTVEAIKNGFALITEERRETGIYPVADIKFNSTVANIHNYTNFLGLLNEQRMVEDTDLQIKNMRIKTASQKELIRSLSGGNQQKVIIGRWLLLNPDILIMDEPTRGIDVGAKYEIYQLMLNLVESGKSIIMVSSEMPELLGITDRIAVMSNGYLADIVETSKTSQEELFRLATVRL
ncbi:MAG: ATP-binding cassette domain-containing protein [Firmicutes bacterium]|nr:ATP-binding cassette domain-containing protein [Bacillota bacterium]